LRTAYLERLELAPVNFHLYLLSRERQPVDWLGKLLDAAVTPALRIIAVRIHLAVVEDITSIDWRRLDVACTRLGAFPLLERVTIRIVTLSWALRAEILQKRRSSMPLEPAPVMPEASKLCYYARATITSKMPYSHRQKLLCFELLDTNGRSVDVMPVHLPALLLHDLHSGNADANHLS
jgi:hypothetical protein